jgi:hypothetical protein
MQTAGATLRAGEISVEGSRSSGNSVLPANHFPDRFALDPSWRGHESARFAFVMRRGTAGPHHAVRWCACLHSRGIPRAQCHCPENARDQWEPPQKTCMWWVWRAASCPTGLRSWSQARFEQNEPDPPALWVPKSVSQAGHAGKRPALLPSRSPVLALWTPIEGLRYLVLPHQ